jgi:hypothetical protein
MREAFCPDATRAAGAKSSPATVAAATAKTSAAATEAGCRRRREESHPRATGEITTTANTPADSTKAGPHPFREAASATIHAADIANGAHTAASDTTATTTATATSAGT